MVKTRSFQFNETYEISTNGYQSVYFKPEHIGDTYVFDVNVKQTRNVNDDIIAYIMSGEDYKLYQEYRQKRKKGISAKINWNTYQSVKVYWSQFIFEPTEIQDYYLVLDNTHSSITSKTVTVKASTEFVLTDRKYTSSTENKIEGAIATEPGSPWSLGKKLEEILEESEKELCIANPYIDNSTFSMIEKISKKVKIKLLISEDDHLSSKVSRGKLDSKKIKKTVTTRSIVIKLIPNLHTRFVIKDKSLVMFLSSDIQADSLSNKYQLGYWSNGDMVVNTTYDYFNNVWEDAKTINILASIKQMENSKEK